MKTIVTLLLVALVSGSPLASPEEASAEKGGEAAGAGDLSVLPVANSTNATEQNLYVIKAIVYEVGILTDIGENDTAENVNREQVDLTFFDPEINGSFINLGDIPLPVQANISGQVITGIAPVDLGSFLSQHANSTNFTDIFSGLPFAETLAQLIPGGSIISPWDTLELYNSSLPTTTVQPPEENVVKGESGEQPPSLKSPITFFPPQNFSIVSSSKSDVNKTTSNSKE